MANPIKQLAGQTAIYGLSSIIARLLNYLLTPLYTLKFATEQYGVITEMYAYVAFLIIFLTYPLADKSPVGAPRTPYLLPELRQYPLRCQPWYRLVSQVRSIAPPRVLGGRGHQSRSHRIQIDVPNQLHQIRIRVHNSRLVTTLEHVPRSPLPFVYPLGMAVTEVLHDARERDLSNLYGKVGMVRQHGERVDAVSEPLYAFLQEKTEAAAIHVVEEDGLACIPTNNDVSQAKPEIRPPAEYRAPG